MKIKVKYLKIGDRVRYADTVAIVREIRRNRVILSKTETGPVWSLPFYSSEYQSLDNEIIVFQPNMNIKESP